MKIISYNVNGLRSAMSKGLGDWLMEVSPDIFCIQETKMQADQRPEDFFKDSGYHSYFHFAEKKGYSGVGLISRLKPDWVETGIGLSKFDSEGRVVRVDIADLTLISLYIPSGTTGDIRQQVKMEFLEAFTEWVEKLREERPFIVLSGDFNICHRPIDINHPERHQQSSGFLPEERSWFDSFLSLGWIDSFREFDSRPEQYSWWSYRAGSRAKNLGWRIDYNLVSGALAPKLRSASILQEVVHSDHCPVVVELND